MDISKLPRLSKTETATGADDGAAPAAIGDPAVAAPPPLATAAPVRAGAWCPNCGAPLLPASRFCNACGARLAAEAPVPAGMGFETIISIAMGLFLLFMAPMGFQYWSAALTGRTFAPYDHPENVGEKVDFTRWIDTGTGAVTDVRYRDTLGFWSDTAITAFALILILDGLVIAFVRRRSVFALTFGLTLLATLLNLGYLAHSFTAGAGFAQVSFLAVLFGGFMCYQQWNLLQTLKPAGAARA